MHTGRLLTATIAGTAGAATMRPALSGMLAASMPHMEESELTNP
jgi:hypothetical protein